MFSLATLIGSKLAVGLITAGVVAAAGTGAAYAGVLPAAVQHTAHDLIGAPQPQTSVQAGVSAEATATATPTATPTSTPIATPTPTATPTATTTVKATPTGPDATGSAAFGLCNAFGHGGLATSSTAYASLVAAAKASANIATYCATITTQSDSAAHKPVASSHSPAPVPTTTPRITLPTPAATVKASVGIRP